MKRSTLWVAVSLIALPLVVAPRAHGAAANPDARALATAHGMLNRGLYAEAGAEYRVAIAGFSESGDRVRELEALYGLGVALLRSGSTQEAIDALAEVARSARATYRAAAASLHADLLRSTGRFGEAAEAAEAFLDEFPDHEARAAIAASAVECRQRLGENARALALFGEHRRTLRPATAHHERAGLFAAIAATGTEPETAIELFGWLAEDAGDAVIREQASWRLGSTLLAVGRVTDAVEALGAAARRAGPATRDHVDLALAGALRLSGDPASGAAVIRELRERSPGFRPGDCAFELGIAELEAGDPSAGAQYLDEAVDLLEGDAALTARYWRARASLALDAYQNAAEALGDLLEHHRDRLPVEAGYDLAVALDGAGRSEEAGRAYGAFRERHPRHPSAPDALFAEASIALNADDTAGARRLSERFVREHGGHTLAPEALFITGEAAYRTEAFARAARAFEAARSGASDDDLRQRAGYRLGMALFRDAEPGEAVAHLTAAAETGRYPAASKALGDIEFEAGRWAGAAAWFERFLATDPASAEAGADAVMRRGLALTRLEEIEEGAAMFARVLEAYPGSVHEAHARFELGQALLLLGRTGEAETLLTETSQDPESRFAPHAYRLLASIASQRGDAGRSAELLGRAADAGLGDEIAIEQASALIGAGRPGEAASLLRGRRDAPSLAWQVVALASSGDHTGAVRALDRLRTERLDVDLATLARYHGARAHREAGDADTAAELYRAVIGTDTGSNLAMHAQVELGLHLAEREGRQAEAESLLSAAIERDGIGEDLCAAAGYRLARLAGDRGDHARVIDLIAPDRRRCGFGELEANAELLLGIALAETGRHGPAADRFEVAVRGFDARDRATNEANARVDPDAEPVVSPELSGALLRLGEARAAAQRWAGSVEAMRRHADQFPEDPLWFRARFGIGWAVEQGGDPEAAIEHYRAVVDRHDGATAARAQFQVGECLFALGRHEEAVRELLRVDILYAEPEWSAAALYEAGRCFEAMGKVGESRAQYRAVAERFPESAWATAAADRLAALTTSEGARRGGAGRTTP